MAKYYRLFVAPAFKNPATNHAFNLWCFHPGFSIKSLLNCGIRSLILTSGTLKPLNAFSKELDVNFQVGVLTNLINFEYAEYKFQTSFSGDHVIRSEQVLVRTFTKGWTCV